MKTKELHWLAGLLEGEGCFTFNTYSPVIMLAMTDEDEVRRAATLMKSLKQK